MAINSFADCTELEAIRTSLIYTKLNPYVADRLAHLRWAGNQQLREENELQLSIEERYLVKLSALLGEVFKNCKSRQVLKQYLIRLISAEDVSCLEAEVLHRTYLNELVVLFERLGRFAVLVRKALGPGIDVSDLELELLGFFDPLLFKKRNYSQHRLYLGLGGFTELEDFEMNVVCQESYQAYREQFRTCLMELVDWIQYTEKSISEMALLYLELVHSKIERDGRYIAPENLSEEFRIGVELKVDFRKKYDHQQVFLARNPDMANGSRVRSGSTDKS